MTLNLTHLHWKKVTTLRVKEDYVPDPDDLGGDPDGVQVKKTKAEGTYMSHMYNRFCQDHYYVGMLASVPLTFRILFTIFVYLLI